MEVSLSLELSIMFDGNLRVTFIAIFIAGFNLSNSEFDIFTFSILYRVIL